MIVFLKYNNVFKELDTEKLSDLEIDFYIRYCKKCIAELDAKINRLQFTNGTSDDLEKDYIDRCNKSKGKYEITLDRLEKVKAEPTLPTEDLPQELFIKAAKTVLFPNLFNKVVKETQRRIAVSRDNA